MYQYHHVRETKLVTKFGGSMDNAAHVCGTRKETTKHKYCTMVVVPDRYPCQFYLAIPEGFYAVVTAYGQYIGIWQPGFHYALPFQRVSHLVTKQYVVYDTPVKECPTLDNVMVEIDVNLVLTVMPGEENIRNFVYKLGPERLEEMLKAFQEEAVRGMARQKKYSDIYDLMDTEELPEFKEKNDALPAGELPAEEVTYDDDSEDEKEEANLLVEEKIRNLQHIGEQLENTKKEINQKLNIYGINVYSITITNVRLPTEFRNQMEEATTFQSKNIEQEYKQKYDLLLIENTEGRNKAMQRMQETKDEEVVKKDQRAASEIKTTEVYKAETNSIIAVIEEKMHAEVRDVKTKCELRVAELDAKKKEELATLAAEAEGEVARIESELEGFIIQRKAQCQKTVAELHAQENLLLAQAEKKIAIKLKSKRDFDAKMSNLLVLHEISKNANCVVSGTAPQNRDSTITQLVGAKNAAFSLNLG